MKPMIQLILQSCNNAQKGYYKNDAKCISQTSNNISSIADVGCDHGLVALSLACMSWAVSQRRRHANSTERHLEDDFVFDRVTGTDISSMALENGGYVSYKKLIDAIMTQSSGSGKQETNTQLPTLPIEFRVGCGLEPLQRGEADAIVLAGMGHLTMLDVLFGSSEVQGERIHPNSDDADLPPVDRIHAQRIFLQPTNSRPQHMIELYDRMHESRMWELKGETIAYVGGRYYINSYFERMSNKIQRELPEDAQYRFPGHFMVRDTLDHAADGGGGVYESYVKHHIQWLKDDYQRPKYKMEEEDRRWLEFISSAEEYKDRWKSSLSWFSH
jgi:tRNA A22 N-methylase